MGQNQTKRKRRLDGLLEAAKELQAKQEFSCIAVARRVDEAEANRYDAAVGATDTVFSGFKPIEYCFISRSKRQLARQLAVLIYREMVKAGAV